VPVSTVVLSILLTISAVSIKYFTSTKIFFPFYSYFCKSIYLSMKLSQYKYNLPQDLIAKFPSDNRDESRLMVLNRKTRTIEHHVFKDIINYFHDGDVMVFNNTKVFPARLYGNKEKTGAEIEVFLLRELNKEQRLWDVLVDPARKIRIGNKLYFGDDDVLVAEVIDNTTSRGRTLRFLFDGSYDEFKSTLYRLGETPLPKFLKRDVVPEDKDRYQTIFAKHEGAVAAPTAGLHFSRELLKRLEIKGVDFAEITLHVGLGNFRSVDVEDLTKHKMDSEQILIPDDAVSIVNSAKDRKGKVCVVGTTVLRTLESSVSTDGYLKPFSGWTNKFIFPPYEFSVPDAMVTNFHLPLSTLLMMVSAFAGYDFLFEAYKVAIAEKYRFGTYGDAMLII
jgi:S-adenosylmethionine:tRNA ribosyltransferase-isomerase